MSDQTNTLTVCIKQTTLMDINRVGANYFIVGRLVQAPSPNLGKELINKQRTDISMNANSGMPVFAKNNMHFKNF